MNGQASRAGNFSPGDGVSMSRAPRCLASKRRVRAGDQKGQDLKASRFEFAFKSRTREPCLFRICLSGKYGD
jgi:hypothetical protein